MSASVAIKEKISMAQDKVRDLKRQIEDMRRTKRKANAHSSACDVHLSNIDTEPRARRKLQGHFGKVYAMHWANDSVHLVSASQDGKLIIWDGVTTRKDQSIPLRSSWVMTCAYDQQKSQLVACGGLDNVCSIYDLSQQQVLRPSHELTEHDGYLSCCRFIGADQILTASGDSTCMLWDVPKNQVKVKFEGHEADVMFVCVSPRDENMFVSGSVDESAKVWDMRTGECVYTFTKYHTSDINCVDFFPEGYSIGTGSDDSTNRIFDIRCYGEVACFGSEAINCGITSVSFSRSGRILFSGYDDYRVCGWDVADPNSPSFMLKGHENRVSCLGVAPNGSALCTGSWDTLLKIWA